jgi:hypothetical protein
MVLENRPQSPKMTAQDFFYRLVGLNKGERMKKLPFIVLVITLISACASLPPESVSRIPFPENEYQALARTGNAVIRGQAFLKTRGGDVKTGRRQRSSSQSGHLVLFRMVREVVYSWQTYGSSGFENRGFCQEADR